MNADTTKYEIVDLPEAGLQWLHRALQWPEDLPEYDRISWKTNITEMAEFFKESKQ